MDIGSYKWLAEPRPGVKTGQGPGHAVWTLDDPAATTLRETPDPPLLCVTCLSQRLGEACDWWSHGRPRLSSQQQGQHIWSLFAYGLQLGVPE